MPCISEFFGIVIAMYWDEGSHQEPHFHAEHGDYAASVALDGSVAGVARGRRLPVRFDERVWHEATRGFSGRALEVAGGTRKRLELEGLALAAARACEAEGADGTRLAGGGPGQGHG